MISQNSEFLFGFEAMLTNPNGDPDYENKPRMDYETSTLLVSDARRKRDIRDILKIKGHKIFVDTLSDSKVPMDQMFKYIVDEYFQNTEKLDNLLENSEKLRDNWELGEDSLKYKENYEKLNKSTKKTDKKHCTVFNNILFTEIIKDSLIDIRLFGSAMAVEKISRTYTGPVQMSWGYSLHPVELVKSNTITSIMNDDNSTFGKKHQVHYGLVCHYGTINKQAAKLTGMTDEDRDIFRRGLVQGMMDNQTASKQGQSPLFYIEVIYSKEFDGYLGDLRRFVDVEYKENTPIRGIDDLNVDFNKLNNVLRGMKEKGYIDKVVGWMHPYVDSSKLKSIPQLEEVDLLKPIK